MRLLSSIRGRIFLSSAVLGVLGIGLAIPLINVLVTREADRVLAREVAATAGLVESLRATRVESTTQMTRLIADLPKLKAAVETGDPPTVLGIAGGYAEQLKAGLFVVVGDHGQPLASLGRSGWDEATEVHEIVADALHGREGIRLWPTDAGIMEVVAVPIAIGLASPEVLGALVVGFALDDTLAAQLKEATNSDIAFAMNGRIVASTLDERARGQLTPDLLHGGIEDVRIAGSEYVVLPQALGGAESASASVLVLRSRTEQLRFLRSIHAGLAALAVGVVLLAVGVSFAVARSITRPLAVVTGVMRESAATGDVSRKIPLASPGRWEDEDARLLAVTFNTLTDAVARSQIEMAHRERLSSLGRLSAVVAHEVRNPLMIIKASLHTLSQPDTTPADRREAVADIDGEVNRLNRVVNEVLDFARPVQLSLGPTDVNRLCQASAAAVQVTSGSVPVELELGDDLPMVVADEERLRAAVVNVLSNAQQAVAGRVAGEDAAHTGVPPVIVRTEARNGGVQITVTDRGTGIAPGDIGRVFDPFFTTRRAGTGLGLAIAKSTVEGIGGTIRVNSAEGVGTELCIELPAREAAVRQGSV